MWKTISHLFPEEEKNESHLFGRQWFSATKYETQTFFISVKQMYFNYSYWTFLVKEGFFLFNKTKWRGFFLFNKIAVIQGSVLFFSTGCQLVQCAIQWGWMETEQNVLQMDSWLFYYFHVANLPQHHVCSCGSWWTQKFQVQMKTKASSTDRKIEGKAFAPPAHILACFSKVLTLLKAMSSTKQPKMQSRQVESSGRWWF